MKQKFLKYFSFLLFSLFASFMGAYSFYRIWSNHNSDNFITVAPTPKAMNVNMPHYAPNGVSSLDFVKASDISRPVVVYIKGVSVVQRMPSFFDPFGSIGQVGTSGSGVIITSDGYIVTNNHVVKDVQKLEVVLNNNKRTYAAKVVGTDPSCDLALLKIEAKNLPFISFANSDDLPVGAWVLAVGNPFNLTSTVTAGIVSAKGRNINIVHNQFPIESFIQTDAAINPGNSGGALVNTDGELVGINTAIQSETGSYSGYGFAIPSNIVKKVISDIKEFGYSQRAFLEAEVVDIDEKMANLSTDENVSGVYVRKVFKGGNAESGGLQNADIIVKVDGKFIDSRSLFDEQLAYHRPGDKVKFAFKRGNGVKETEITLTNQSGTTTLEKAQSTKSKTLGADFEEITKLEKEKYNVQSGIRISNITGNGKIRNMNLPEGFVVLSFNRKVYDNPHELISAIENTRGQILIEGINPNNGQRITYQFFSY